MSFYPPEVSEKFHSPENAGRIDSPDAVGTQATFVCGAVLRVMLKIDQHSGQITAAKFQTDGCGFLIASADILTKEITNRTLSELHGLDEKVTRKKIEEKLEVFPPDRTHCLKLAIKTLQAAFADLRRAWLEEWSGEKALICSCFGVSEETIENLVAENSLQTVREVTERCRAGGGCGSCQPLIQEIIDVNFREQM